MRRNSEDAETAELDVRIKSSTFAEPIIWKNAEQERKSKAFKKTFPFGPQMEGLVVVVLQ